MQKLERLGLATTAGPAQWTLSPDAESSLRALGDRGDIIKRLHQNDGCSKPLRVGHRWRGQRSGQLDRQAGRPGPRRRAEGARLTPSSTALTAAPTTYACRTWTRPATRHWVPSSRCGGSLTRVAASASSWRCAPTLSVEAQATAQGATWLDRRLIAREAAAPLSENGYGADVRAALDRRTEYLVSDGIGAAAKSARAVCARPARHPPPARAYGGR